MSIIFHTDNLNKRLYKRMVENILINLDQNAYEFLKKWRIHIWSLKGTDSRYFDHVKTTSGQRINPRMPSGVTGKYRIDLYLHDKDGRLYSAENGDRVQHELCHAILFGTPNFVDGVHDNLGNRFTIKFWYWDKIFWKRFQMTVIDIRDYL